MKKNTQKKIILGLALITNVAFNLPSFSQGAIKSNIEDNVFLTLNEAIKNALKNNHSLKVSNEQINAAKYQITESAAQGLPQLSITTSYNRQDPVNAPPPAPGLSNPQFAAFLGTARVNTFRNNVNLSQVLFAGFRVVDGIKLANMNLNLSEEGLRQSKHNIVNQVSNAYFNALKALKLVEINKQALKQAELHVDQTKKFLDAGISIKLDLIRAENQLVNTQLELSKSLNNLNKAKISLNMIMGRQIDRPIRLNTLAKIPELKINNKIDDLISRGLKGRSELRQLKIKKDMDIITTTIQGRASWPMVTANASYNINDTQVVDSNSANTQNLTYGVNMNWPIFDGLLTYAKVQKAQNNVIQDQINIDQLQQNIVLEIRQAHLDYLEAKERIILAKKSLKLSDESLRIAKVRYNNGVGINLDVIDQQTMLNQTKINLIIAEFDLNLSRAKLYKAIGVDI